MCFVTFFGFYFSCVRGTKTFFAFTQENSPVQPLPVRSAGGARFNRWGQSSWAGGYNTKINHHVWLKNIKLLSSPSIRAMHDGLLRVPLTTVVTRGREGGGGRGGRHQASNGGGLGNGRHARGRRSPRPSLHHCTSYSRLRPPPYLPLPPHLRLSNWLVNMNHLYLPRRKFSSVFLLPPDY